jgi:hypothetical protein
MGCKGLFKSCLPSDIDNLRVRDSFSGVHKKRIEMQVGLSILTYLQIWKIIDDCK